MKCRRCKATAQVKLPSHHTGFCPDCFKLYYSRQVERAIKSHKMFTREEKVLVALSGGKDSLALMLVLAELGYDVTGLHVYLGIHGSSDGVREVVEGFCEKHGLKLIVADMTKEGLAIPDVKKCVNRPICAVCGRIKRYYFNKVAMEQGFDALATGHNLDDEVARLFSNTLRWDKTYLGHQAPCLPAADGFVRKTKPLYRLTEFENACYSFLRGIDHWKPACPYSEGASFTGHKELMEQLEEKSPGSKIQFYEKFLENARPVFEKHVQEDEDAPKIQACGTCGYPTIGDTCGTCHLKKLVNP